MMMTSSSILKIIITVLAGLTVIDGQSRCPGVGCLPDPGGCQPRYDRDDGCCPVWRCSNGFESYGKTGGGSSGSFSSFSSSSGGEVGGISLGLGNIFGRGRGGGGLGGLLGSIFGG